MEVVASLSQGRTAAAQCGLFTHKSVPVIFEPPCTFPEGYSNPRHEYQAIQDRIILGAPQTQYNIDYSNKTLHRLALTLRMSGNKPPLPPHVLMAWARNAPHFLNIYIVDQRFSNYFQVGTTFISQNVLRTTLLLGLSNSSGLP